MLKIFINNEEVVCDKQLEIKEEMLSTSSCILNNCYPKSWENTKDYTSQYYYPKDYSKCKIYNLNENIINNFEIEGTLIQNGEPSPTNEIMPLPKTGNIIENIGGKNYLLSLNNIELCGLENIKDKIFYNNNKWYLKKSIGKIVLNGEEAWSYHSRNSNRTQTALFSLLNVINDMKHVSYDYNTKSNYFIAKNVYQNDIEGYFVHYSSRSYIYIAIQRNILNSLSLFKEWLAQHNVVIYYVLQTPTITEITDITLINQLNNVGKDLIFCGVVKNTGNINLNPRYPHYCNLEVLDFKTFLSECDQLDFVINNKTITEAIEQVTQAVSSYGFVLGNININDDTIIGAYSTQEKTPYDVFQYLADISQSRWYTRLIDENTVAIDFYDPLAMERGIDLDFSNNEFACENNIEDLSFNYGTYDYRNKQIMLSEQVYGGVDFDETIVSNGYNNSFTTSTPIGILKAITINGENATFATNEDKMIGIEADFYYTIGETLIEGEIYPTGTVINIIYTPLIKGREIINNTNEITRITNQICRKGVISRYEKRNDILSSNALNLIGTSYLKYKGTPEINLTVVTKDVDLYNIGQIVYFNYPNIQELSQDYMVKSKKTKIINTSSDWNIWYTYILSSNFNSENAINYFDNQRAKSSGNIQKGDYITRNIDIEKNCNIIFSNPSAEEITILGDNILNSPLNSPFIK